MADSWETIRQKFARIAAKEGVANVAPRIPARRETVYRILRGSTKKPTLAVQQGIQKLVKSYDDNHKS